MPIYEYRCDACGHDLEVLQKVSDPPLLECPSCGEKELRKLISAAGFRLKGGGWYETDFKSGNKKNVYETGVPSEKKEKPQDKSKPEAKTASAGSGGQAASAKATG